METFACACTVDRTWTVGWTGNVRTHPGHPSDRRRRSHANPSHVSEPIHPPLPPTASRMSFVPSTSPRGPFLGSHLLAIFGAFGYVRSTSDFSCHPWTCGRGRKGIHGTDPRALCPFGAVYLGGRVTSTKIFLRRSHPDAQIRTPPSLWLADPTWGETGRGPPLRQFPLVQGPSTDRASTNPRAFGISPPHPENPPFGSDPSRSNLPFNPPFRPLSIATWNPDHCCEGIQPPRHIHVCERTTPLPRRKKRQKVIRKRNGRPLIIRRAKRELPRRPWGAKKRLEKPLDRKRGTAGDKPGRRQAPGSATRGVDVVEHEMQGRGARSDDARFEGG